MGSGSTSGSRVDMIGCAVGLGIELLNESNYTAWRSCMKSYLVGEDLWDVVDGDDIQRPPATPDNSDALKEWDKLNARAEFALKRCISYRLFNCITGCNSAHRIWQAIERKINERSDDYFQSEAAPNVCLCAGDFAEGEDHVIPSQTLYDAARKGNWNAVDSIFENYHDSLKKRITSKGETALHVAIDFGQTEFVEKLVALMPEGYLEICEYTFGHTALHYAAISGSLIIVKILVDKHEKLTQIADKDGRTPLHSATYMFQSKEIVRYLTSKISQKIHTSPFFAENNGGELMCRLVSSRSYDICLDLLKRDRHLSTAQSLKGIGMLPALVYNPFDFPSGSKLAFWERFLYRFIPVESHQEQRHSRPRSDLENQEERAILTSSQSMTTYLIQVMHRINGVFWTIFGYLVPGIKRIKDEKYNHKCTQEMVEIACKQMLVRSEEEIVSFFTGKWDILYMAAVNGIEELITTCLREFPYLINSGNMLDAAILHRKEKVFNLFLGGTGTTKHVIRHGDTKRSGSWLHKVAKLAPYPHLSSVSCPALQMQRELQWYKAAEELVSPTGRRTRNKDMVTPREIFTTEHKELLKDAEKWMRDTSNSCMVVSTLIATVVFAAAFTVPGGNVDGKGIPVFLEERVFMLFAISDALALFSSTTSMLMFLSILTARYAEEDFLSALPKRLILGFASLFIAIATMMVAFGATLYMVLSERFGWIFIPIIAATSIPVALFVMLQLPLFIFMVRSTYGPSIFHPARIW